MPWTVALTCFSGAAASSIHWKGEGSVDNGKSEPAEGHHTKARQGSTKASRPRGSSKGRSAHLQFIGVLLVLFFLS